MAEIRWTLEREDFRRLVRGFVVRRTDGVAIVLGDIGFAVMAEELAAAMPGQQASKPPAETEISAQSLLRRLYEAHVSWDADEGNQDAYEEARLASQAVLDWCRQQFADAEHEPTEQTDNP